MGGGLVLVLVNGDSARVLCGPVGSAHPDEDKHKAQYCSNKENLSVYGRARINRIERAIAHI